MDLSTLLLAVTLASLFLTGTVLMAAMVMMERPAPATARRGRAPKRTPRPRSRRSPASWA
jgi:hypothetical protein